MKKFLFVFVVAALLFAAVVSPAYAQEIESREARLVRLDTAFREESPQAWLAQFVSGPAALAGMDARQPEEETLTMSDGSLKIVISGLQVENAQGLYVAWPAVVTTDDPSRVVENSDTRKFQPDPQNGSTLYTNVTISGDGLVTIWADATNWSQMQPEGYVAPVTSEAPVVAENDNSTSKEVTTIVGEQGIQGPVGSQGEQGVQGPIGPQGAQGVKGQDGKDGKNAPFWAFWLVGGIALAALIVALWSRLTDFFANDDEDNDDGESALVADTKSTPPTPPVAPTPSVPVTPEPTELEKAKGALKNAEANYDKVWNKDKPYEGKDPQKLQNYEDRKAAVKKEMEEAKAAVEKLQPSASTPAA